MTLDEARTRLETTLRSERAREDRDDWSRGFAFGLNEAIQLIKQVEANNA